jgi:hypothetical protein
MRRRLQNLALAFTLALGAGALMYGQQYPQQYPDNRPYDRGGYGYSGNDASGIGYGDGLRDGQHDWYTGHRFRPEHSGNFKHADRGYDHHFGPKWQYKQAYRDGYVRGYQRGYGEQYRGGYRRGDQDDYGRGYRY